MKKVIISLLSIVFSLSVVAGSVWAESTATNSASSNKIRNNIQEREKELKQRIASKAAERKEKLDQVKKKVCETRKSLITKRSQAIAKRAERQFKIFGDIANRVDNFYQNKLVPKGITIVNYDQFKLDIQAQKDEVTKLIETAKTDAKNFDCAGDNPKGQLANFRADMKATIEALKDFRTTVKNFIVAVRTANATSEASGSAESSQ